MPIGREITAESAAHALARRANAVAWAFFVIVALLGVLLRWQMLRPFGAVNYAYLLHAHSHVAFMGWIFNAFFALALRFWVGPDEVVGYRRLFWILQVAVVGMLVSFPLQGYALGSIAFSTLHMIGSGVFAWKLWGSQRVAPAARGWLRVALAFMVLSGLGPLALGPFAALGMRESPGYTLSIYFYLHCQYNGWFVFFLLAVLQQQLAEKDVPVLVGLTRRALTWLAIGAGLTYALSALWLHPPMWVRGVAWAGGVAQLFGCGCLLAALRPARSFFAREWGGVSRQLMTLALGALVLKLTLQFLGAWPELTALANHRFIVIAFLHLVFLGVVTPVLIAWALDLGWLEWNARAKLGLALFLAGAAFTEIALVIPSVLSGGAWLASAAVLLSAAVVLATGVGLVGTSARRT